jgi:predicted nucleic acid-binding protein
VILNPWGEKNYMTGKVFIDTNIFLYAKFDDGNEKFKIANNLFNTFFQIKKPFISTQVVNEFCVNAIKKGGDPLEIRATATQFDKYFYITPVTMNTIIDSFHIYESYQFSHWDCLIVAAALESGCEILYTEDLSDGQIINGTLKIVNPFIYSNIVNIVISEK